MQSKGPGRPWLACAVCLAMGCMLAGPALPAPASRGSVDGALPQCSNAVDDDLDGRVDFPADPGCDAATADSETPEPACADGVDNDLDGSTDHPDDLDCFAATDPSESPACSDGADNDADGVADAEDPQCADADDRTESDAPACSNRVDDDLDGAIDFPADPGCNASHDDTEGADPVDLEPGRPRVLLAIAGSGSLNDDACGASFTGGDGSLECPGDDVACGVCAAPGCGNGLADDSRLWSLREALRSTIARTGGVEVGLLRARQRAGAFTCPGGDVRSASGGWLGAGDGCGGGFDAGEVVIAVEDDTWPAFDQLFDGSGGTDLMEPGRDIELRGSGLRPLGGILQAALLGMQDRRAGDPAAACRPYRIVLLSDGAEQCAADPASVAGQSFQEGIAVHVVGLPGASATDLDPIAAAGGTGSAVMLSDGADLASALLAMLGQLPLHEACNGVDDDCDGSVDEDFPQLGATCDNGQLGACRRDGAWQCDGSGGASCSAAAIGPSTEVCNGLDDDCDGHVDEDGVCAAEEQCNGIDDDQDGSVDEDFAIGAPCSSGLGACMVPGTLACSADQQGVECRPTGGPRLPARHDLACDGIDEDCDGLVDEDASGAMVSIDNGTSGFFMDRYEASRPDATATSEGWLSQRACAEPDVLPWRNLAQAEAAQACAAAGKRLCTGPELGSACSGPGGLAYPYGPVYDPDACNGEDHDAQCAAPDTDAPVRTGGTRGCPAGAASTCVASAGIDDLSGNLREWSATLASVQTHATHGGGYLDQAPALACAATTALDSTARHPDVGFRCCADMLPELPPVLDVSVSAADLGRVTSAPAGIHCPYDCQQDYPPGSTVELQPVAYPGARFVGWSGDCSGEQACTLSMTGDAAVLALFELVAPVGEAIFADGFEP